jgi:hypothetical protein
MVIEPQACRNIGSHDVTVMNGASDERPIACLDLPNR